MNSFFFMYTNILGNWWISHTRNLDTVASSSSDFPLTWLPTDVMKVPHWGTFIASVALDLAAQTLVFPLTVRALLSHAFTHVRVFVTDMYCEPPTATHRYLLIRSNLNTLGRTIFMFLSPLPLSVSSLSLCDMHKHVRSISLALNSLMYPDDPSQRHTV